VNIDKHPLVKHLLIVDSLGVALPVYEPVYDVDEGSIKTVALDRDCKSIILDPRYHSGYGLNRIIIPMEITHEVDAEIFERGFLDCLIKAATINGNVFNTVRDIDKHYRKWDLEPTSMIIPMGDMPNYKIPSAINAAMLLGNGQQKFYRSKYLTDRIIVVPDPEFLGVCAMRSRLLNTQAGKIIEEAEYGIGIINSRGVCVLE
jgi:hypothetical protein